MDVYDFSAGAIPPKLEQGRLSFSLPAVKKKTGKNKFTPLGFTPISGRYVPIQRESRGKKEKHLLICCTYNNNNNNGTNQSTAGRFYFPLVFEHFSNPLSADVLGVDLVDSV